MEKKIEFNVKNSLVKLIAKCDRSFFQERRKELEFQVECGLRDTSHDGLWSLGITLDSLAHLEGIQGIVELATGNQDGWRFLGGWLAYAVKSVQVRLCLFQSGVLLDGLDHPDLNLAARCLAHAMATRDDAVANWCGANLVRALTGRTGLFHQWKAPFEQFITVFYCWSSGSCDPFAIVNSTDLGGYSEIFQSWDSIQLFEHSLMRACDYHCNRAVRMGGPYFEFVREPHNYLPAEILAVLRVREDQGLPIPKLNHPLLQTPLVDVPKAMPVFQSDLLSQLSSRFPLT